MSLQLSKLIKKEKFISIVCLDEFADCAEKIKYANINAISIRTPCTTRQNHEKYEKIDSANIQNIFITKFDDVVAASPKAIPPTYKQVVDILIWAKKKYSENQNSFVVHCTAGVSRSSAIAVLIAQMIKGNGLAVINPDLHSPNKLIIQYGEKYLGTNHLEKEIQKILDAWRKKFLNVGVSF